MGLGRILCFDCTNPFHFYFSDAQTVWNKDKGKIQTFDNPVSTYIPIVNIARLDIIETGSDSNLTLSLSKLKTLATEIYDIDFVKTAWRSSSSSFWPSSSSAATTVWVEFPPPFQTSDEVHFLCNLALLQFCFAFNCVGPKPLSLLHHFLLAAKVKWVKAGMRRLEEWVRKVLRMPACQL